MRRKITVIILAVLLILASMPSVWATDYYKHEFELPLCGSTGCLVKDSAGIKAGAAFVILEENGENLKVKLSDGEVKSVAKAFCMVNLPDVLPSIVYNVTNSYSSLFKVLGKDIEGVTGKSLYRHGSSEKYNARLGRREFLVPVLFETAVKIASVQKQAFSEGYTLVIYEAYRPMYAQEKIRDAYAPLVTRKITGGWSKSWFIANGKSNHQEGYAIDVSLAKVGGEPCAMITPIHELSIKSAVYKSAEIRDIYSKKWQNYNQTTAFAANSSVRLLQRLMTNAGLAPLASEWWHFHDIDARNALGDRSDILGDWELTECKSELP